MAITIGVPTISESILREPFVIAEDEVLDYLEKLDGYPMMTLLSQVDRYGLTTFNQNECQQLHDEVLHLLVEVESCNMPEPPNFLRTAGRFVFDEEDEFGWRGFLDFLQELHAVCRSALNCGLGIVAIGD